VTDLTVSDEEMREAFRRMREDLLPSVDKSSAGQVRRRVRRRRRALAVATSAGTLVGSLVVIALVVPPPGKTVSAPDGGDPRDRLLGYADSAQTYMPTRDTLLGGSDVADARHLDVSDTTVAPGTYRLDAKCVGVGSIHITLTIGGRDMGDDISCVGAAGSFTLAIPQAGDRMAVAVDPAPDAVGAAGYAYAVTRVTP